MAKTRAGRDLTDTHRQQQVVLRASIEQAATALDELMDLDDVAGSFPAWFAGRSVLANAGIETSRRLATAYVGEYGRAEAGVELVAGRPGVDPQRVAFEAHVDAVVMTKARIAAGMSPEEAWRIQSAISYGKLGQMVLDAGRQTITTSSFKYSGRRGRWRRVSDGAPCAFCAMLVGRGPVYQEQSVQFRAHNHCGCTAELVLHEWEPTEEEALYRASYLQAALDAEEEFGRSWARTAAGENQILARMRRNNPGLFNDGVFAKDSQFRSPAWVKAKESTRRRREKIKLATGRGGGGAKPPRMPSSDGMEVPDWLNDETLDKVLNGRIWVNSKGETTLKGGHASGRNWVGKTEFSSQWSRSDVRQAIIVTRNDPAVVRKTGDRTEFRRIVDGDLIHVSVYENNGEIFRGAHAIGGANVFLNTIDGKVRKEIPNDWNSKEERWLVP